MMGNLNKRLFIYLVFCSLLISGCATSIEDSSPIPSAPITKKGIYHKVGKGQTLWRIAKAYGSSINEIILSNNIPNVAKLEENQLIYIPGAERVLDVPIENKESNNDFIWPLKGKVLNYFRESKGSVYNNGIDILAEEGEAVKASRAGKVVLSDYLSGYGYTVILDHGDSYYSVYAQNAKLLVNLGDAVHQGESLAYLGKTKDRSFLHFEIRKNSVADNPLYYLP